MVVLVVVVVSTELLVEPEMAVSVELVALDNASSDEVELVNVVTD